MCTMPWVCVCMWRVKNAPAAKVLMHRSQPLPSAKFPTNVYWLQNAKYTHTHLCIQYKWYCSQTLAARNQTRIHSLSWMGSENEQKFYDFYHVFNCKCIGFLCVFRSISAVLCLSHSVSCFLQHWYRCYKITHVVSITHIVQLLQICTFFLFSLCLSFSCAGILGCFISYRKQTWKIVSKRVMRVSNMYIEWVCLEWFSRKKRDSRYECCNPPRARKWIKRIWNFYSILFGDKCEPSKSSCAPIRLFVQTITIDFQ